MVEVFPTLFSNRLRILTGVFLFFLIGQTSAQSIPQMIKIADDLFASERYLEAIEFYQKISRVDKKNHQAIYQLGLAQMHTLQYKEARGTFLNLSLAGNHEFQSQALYHYAFILKLESKYQLADSLFAKLISLEQTEPALINLARRQKEGCQLALRDKGRDRGFSVRPLTDLNSKFHDFGAVLNPRNQHLIFATTRTVQTEQYEGIQYSGVLPDLVSYRYTIKKKWKNETFDDGFNRVNSEWSEGSGTFTQDGLTFYFTSCKGERGSECQILASYFGSKKWSSPTPLNEYINEPGSENKQPSLSTSGDTLYFVSDRVGGIGGSDLWMSLRGLEKDSWSPAINLGETINTVENEISPYYSSAFQSLIFSSNGQVGYGGYDLYLAKGESFFEPQLYNLGDPFNSSGDDLYFNISDSLGFLTSNRLKRSALDLYAFDVPNEKLFLSLLISGETLIDSRIISRFINVRSLDLYSFRAEDYEGYELFEPAKREKPKPAILQSEQEEEEETNTTDLVITAPPPPATNRILASTETITHPENRFRYSGDAPSGTSYESLYFGFGSSDLDGKSKQALDDLIRQVEIGKIQRIELLAYTDPIGSNDYNYSLSEKRGNAAAGYLVSKGMDASKIRVLPRGELVESNSKQGWLSRIFQRRVEVFIKPSIYTPLDRFNNYLVRKEMTVSQAAGFLRIDVQQLQAWNQFTDETLSKGSLLRVKSSLNPNLKYFLSQKDLKNTFFIHEVQPGENLQSIARRYNTLEEVIWEVNDVELPLSPGKDIYIYQINP